jgi:hypothetical protein
MATMGETGFSLEMANKRHICYPLFIGLQSGRGIVAKAGQRMRTALAAVAKVHTIQETCHQVHKKNRCGACGFCRILSGPAELILQICNKSAR